MPECTVLPLPPDYAPSVGDIVVLGPKSSPLACVLAQRYLYGGRWLAVHLDQPHTLIDVKPQDIIGLLNIKLPPFDI